MKQRISADAKVIMAFIKKGIRSNNKNNVTVDSNEDVTRQKDMKV